MMELMLLGSSGFTIIYMALTARKLSASFTNDWLHEIPDQIYVTPRDLPSVTVCIPARNEAHAMARCLDNVLASDYPKLEILVLDDSSTDTTSTLIKAFAHQGVRFIAGRPLPIGWLGKNFALETLLEQASGSYVLFMDVDTHIQPQTVTRLIQAVNQHQLEMASVVPQRGNTLYAGSFLTPLRYGLELVLQTSIRPATASALWVIRRDVLKEQLGGFTSYRNDVQPESRFAADCAQRASYAVAAGSSYIGVSYEKKWSSQIETSIRLLAPRLGYSWWRSFWVLLVLVILFLPFVSLIIACLMTDEPLLLTSSLAGIALLAVYGYYLYKVGQAWWGLALLMWPYVVVQEMVLFLLSQYRYAQGAVTWKGRSVTISSTGRQK